MKAKCRESDGRLKEIRIVADTPAEERLLAKFYLDMRRQGRAILVLPSAKRKLK